MDVDLPSELPASLKKTAKRRKMSSSIILNIPHSSTLLPLEDIPLPYDEPSGAAYNSWGGKYCVRKRILEDYRKELLYMTDWYTDELFINGIGKPLVAPVSRLLCDMERFKDDLKEEMSTIGMGICYSSTHNLEKLSSFRLSHKKAIIEKYYDPYHRTLQRYVEEAFEEHGRVLILDCHSFSNVPFRCDLNRGCDRSDICIGTDNDHTPDDLVDMVREYFEGEGYSVKLDYPFSGTIIPGGFERNENLLSVMIEVNRNLYLEKGKDKKPMRAQSFEKVKRQIHTLEERLAIYMDECNDR